MKHYSAINLKLQKTMKVDKAVGLRARALVAYCIRGEIIFSGGKLLIFLRNQLKKSIVKDSNYV